MATTVPVTMDTLVTIKISIQGSNRKFKVPMRDLGAAVLPTKLRQLLNIPPNQQVTFERFSDSAGAYITLDPENPQVYKTLFRAAKAKLKLRLRATVTNEPTDKPEPLVPSSSSTPEAANRIMSPPLDLPTHNMPALASRAESIRSKESRSRPAAQQQNNTGTIPLYPYARLPAFHKTDMKTSLPSSASAAERNGEAPVPQPFVARPHDGPEDEAKALMHGLFQQAERDVHGQLFREEVPELMGRLVNSHKHREEVRESLEKQRESHAQRPIPGLRNTEELVAETQKLREAAFGNKPEVKKEDGIPALFSKLDGIMNSAQNTLNKEGIMDPKDSSSVATSTWSVYCNQCDCPITNEHFHCSICDEGDYDLCKACVDAGEHCPVSAHWLVKRFIQNGKVTNSTTERIGPKSKPEDLTMEFEAKSEPVSEENKGMPGAYFGDAIDRAPFGDAKPQVGYPFTPTRTCNCCVKELPEPQFVHCVDCEDYDLCLSCHVSTQHGHHPGHAFEPVVDGPSVGPLAKFLCGAGRNARHSAVCDGCEEYIYGVRHKCLNCPDWDYCGKCIKNAKSTHPTHRFVPIYEPLPEPRTFALRHFGIYCDGPLCKNKDQTYIEGVRYKCAVCDDLDFCASCEAAPENRHNRTHPLIKFKTPVRKVTVTTAGEDKWGKPMPNLGDVLPMSKPAPAESQRPAFNNASTQIRTVVDLKPSTETQPAEDAVSKAATDKIEIKDLLAEPLDRRFEALKNVPLSSGLSIRPKHGPADALNAHFIRDTICDGTQISANHKFLQVWTLRNPGPLAWPAGCSVRYVGGDNMLNVDNETSSNASNIVDAVESNVMNRTVEAGEEAQFGVLMKAPSREGVSISYWRVKAPDGTPFGHRLWCHINVTKPSPVPVESPQSSDSERVLLRLKELRERRQLPESSELDRASRRRELIRRSTQLIRERRMEREAAERMEREAAESAETAALMARVEAVGAEATKKSLKPTVEDVPESETSDSTTKADPKVAKTVESKTEPTAEGSRMVFPTLEKESPESSNHEAAKSDKTSVPASDVETEIFEDAETVDISSDDGFLTDEEYDVLDASDEEFVA